MNPGMRIRFPLRLVAFVVSGVVVLHAAEVHAEVCDKVVEGTWFLPVILVTILAGITSLVATARWPWSVFIIAPIVPSPMLLVDWDVYGYAMAEGCGWELMRTPVVGTAAVLVCAVVGLVLHWVRRRGAGGEPPRP